MQNYLKKLLLVMLGHVFLSPAFANETLLIGFQNPPPDAKPWVYWFVMDGNLTQEGITADFEAMQRAGIGGMIFMEVNVGIPRGNIDFMSGAWLDLMTHAIREAERLDLQFTIPTGPGWAGSGGPWVKPENSMLHLVASETQITGPGLVTLQLPAPKPKRPFFGEGILSPEQEKERLEYFNDHIVLAFPKPKDDQRVADAEEKALYYRAPYTSQPGVKPRLLQDSAAQFPDLTGINKDSVLNLTDRMSPDGTLTWDVPEGEWTIMRFGTTSTGANTRPAPAPGFGLEASKLDRNEFDVHLKNYLGKILDHAGRPDPAKWGGWKWIHIDSWEMGPQNWSADFALEFQKRRGYDMTPFLPCYSGLIVETPEITERFLWDMRMTAQELLLENHAGYLKEFAHQNGLKLSMEIYDMTPCSDMALGGVADMPMCEFWSPGGFPAEFSVFEAVSVAHTNGSALVPAEAFTSGDDAWRSHPGYMKQQGDWAFCAGVNRFSFHRFQHQPFVDRVPGMTMGPYGIHWDSTQTFWELLSGLSGYHTYLTRCQFLLQQGSATGDVLYLLPEGAPQVFTAPASAFLPPVPGIPHAVNYRDKRGYSFAACDPVTLLARAEVRDGKIVFPGGAAYSLLVLPNVDEMTPELLAKIEELLQRGANVVGRPPTRSPSLVQYPTCDANVRQLAGKLWRDDDAGSNRQGRMFSSGLVTTQSKTIDIDQAKWIWYPEGNPEYDAPAGTRTFVRQFELDEGFWPVSGMAAVAVDNGCTLWVNGQECGKNGTFHELAICDISHALQPGVNSVRITAVNDESPQRNPAGLIAQVEITGKDGRTLSIPTDQSWECFQGGDVSAAASIAAKELGPANMAPWGKPRGNKVIFDKLYPDYSLTASILESLGIPEDFSSSNDEIRSIRRTVGDTDIYFLANRTDAAICPDVTFRVDPAKHISLWNPMNGKRYRLPMESPVSTTPDGRVRFALPLDASDSVFVIFEKTQSGQTSGELPVWRSGQRTTASRTLDGAWEVTFSPRYGGPGKVTFPQLIDWCDSDTQGVKYYSGIAEYEKEIVMTDDDLADGQRIELDLGTVEVMAQVLVNGREVGTVWKSPYTLDMTDALTPGKNRLTIRVANLWINRLILDAQLPEAERATWTTWNPYHAQSKPPASGLIGPVTWKSVK